ncbi:MAG: HIRAN domain-containing protein [Bacteroidota bacterium]
MGRVIRIPSAFVIDTKVVGVSQENSDGTSRQEIIRSSVQENDPLVLAPEPDNPYDPNAVKVLNGQGQQIGYLPREVAGRVNFALDNAAEVVVKASWVSGAKMTGVGLRIELAN